MRYSIPDALFSSYCTEKQLVTVEKVASKSNGQEETLHGIVDRLEDILVELHGHSEEHLQKADKSNCASNDAEQQPQLLLKSSSCSNSHCQDTGLACDRLFNEGVMSSGLDPPMGCSTGTIPGNAVAAEGPQSFSKSKRCIGFVVDDDDVFKATQDKGLCQIASSMQADLERSNNHCDKYSHEEMKDPLLLLGNSEISEHSFMPEKHTCAGRIPVGLWIDEKQNVRMPELLVPDTKKPVEVQSIFSLTDDKDQGIRDKNLQPQDTYAAFQRNNAPIHCVVDKDCHVGAAVDCSGRCNNDQPDTGTMNAITQPLNSNPVAEGSGDKSINQFEDNNVERLSKPNSEEGDDNAVVNRFRN